MLSDRDDSKAYQQHRVWKRTNGSISVITLSKLELSYLIIIGSLNKKKSKLKHKKKKTGSCV